MFPLTNDDKGRLMRLNQQKDTVLSLKKLFLVRAMKGVIPTDVQTLAAERIALDILQDAFHQLEVIQPEPQTTTDKANFI